MCGIAGFWRWSNQGSARLGPIVRGMADALAHRGPDGAGEWSDPAAGIALAHRRLSILDLSAAGAQPMTSPSGRYVIVFNGEIYNHLDLRARLGKEVDWIGRSDTETLLCCIERWGLEDFLEHACGMFALALWDKLDRSLTLVRDRMGEKPLFYGLSGDALLFGSELKAIMRYPGFDPVINEKAVSSFLRFSYVPEPASYI